MSTDHPKAIRDYLVAQGMSSSKVFAGPIHRDAPKDGVYITPFGGPQPDSFFGTTNVLKYVDIQIMVIGGPGRHQDAHAQAIVAFDHLINAAPSGYLILQAIQPQPTYLGTDNDDRSRYVFNIRAKIVE